ncbi:hypothetical protein TSAR_010171 [Trichomalopsis sarcophagae]|uniref:MD-2-related lipid-recognition domain-containing protein n=1 Tax=Trichomalopsis sarcophagae TaxID=543379 RepID=A0A232ETK0_9HYME|nr:hypothetical protein TSAR_010171 [Trichomalopsis sarcophagae]
MWWRPWRDDRAFVLQARGSRFKPGVRHFFVALFTPSTPNVCTIHEVRVLPCKEAVQGKACNLKKGEDAKISFDFTPKFDASKVESRAYWPNQLVDLPLMGMESDACKDGTTCPLAKDTKYTYNINLPISKKFPTLIEICGKAIPNCITHNSLFGQFHFPTTFGLESQLYGPNTLEKKGRLTSNGNYGILKRKTIYAYEM